MNPIEEYLHERDLRVKDYMKDKKLCLQQYGITETLVRIDYVKNFTWLGLPIMQQPSDMFVMQELITRVEPDFLIETGVAFGGSLLFYATVMEGLEWGRVIGIDNDIREHTRTALRCHPLEHRFHLIEGDSTNRETLIAIKRHINPDDKIMVVLDSNHSHNHVLKELQLYSPFVSKGSYIVVFDTTIETMIESAPTGKDYGPGNNPMTAVKEFMKGNKKFVVDREFADLSFITSAAGGFLRRVK